MGMSMGMAIFPIPMMPMIFPFILEGNSDPPTSSVMRSSNTSRFGGHRRDDAMWIATMVTSSCYKHVETKLTQHNA